VSKKRILFITSTRIGDAVLSTGLLNYLVESEPDAHFTVACGPIAAPLFKGVPRLERIITIEKKKGGAHWFSLWNKCAGHWWSMVVDLRSSAIAYLLPTFRRRALTPIKTDEHRLTRIARVLSISKPLQPKIWTTEEAEQMAAQEIPEVAGALLAVGPTANWVGKQWPIERFVELVERIIRPGAPLEGARVAVLGAAAERDMAQPLIDNLPERTVIDLVGHLDLLAVAACLRRSSLFIGNDSGLMHMSAAVGTPTLGLFGPSREEHYAPRGRFAATVRGDQSFFDIVNEPTFDHLAPVSYMKSLTVDRVEEAALALIKDVQAAAASDGNTYVK